MHFHVAALGSSLLSSFPCSYLTVPALDAFGRRLLPFGIESDVARFVYLDRNVTNDFAKFVNTFHYYFQQCMTTKIATNDFGGVARVGSKTWRPISFFSLSIYFFTLLLHRIDAFD